MMGEALCGTLCRSGSGSLQLSGALQHCTAQSCCRWACSSFEFIPAAEPDEPQGEFSITVNEDFTLHLRAADVDTLTRWLSALHAINHVASGGRHALGEHADEHADAADGASVFEYRVSAKRWEPFSDAECERIAAAVASEPNGRIALGKSQEIRFGNAAL